MRPLFPCFFHMLEKWLINLNFIFLHVTGCHLRRNGRPLGQDSTCVYQSAAHIMAKADRDDALDTLVRIFLLRYVRDDRNSLWPGVEAVRRNAGRHRGRCCIAVAPGGGAEQEEV